ALASPETPAENRAPLKVRPSGLRAAADAAKRAAARTKTAPNVSSRFTDRPSSELGEADPTPTPLGRSTAASRASSTALGSGYRRMGGAGSDSTREIK